jgi:hypothetical protein
MKPHYTLLYVENKDQQTTNLKVNYHGEQGHYSPWHFYDFIKNDLLPILLGQLCIFQDGDNLPLVNSVGSRYQH